MDRLWAKVQRAGPDECWPWTGAVDSDGYGRIGLGGTARLVHRVVYELEVGPIPDGMEVRHTCDNPPCCNPAHLLPGTHAENMADMVERGRHVPRPAHDERTHCKNDHPFTEENTNWMSPPGRRPYKRCRRCQAEASARYQKRKLR